MNTEQLIKTLWEVLNSPAAIAFIASLVLYALNKLYAKQPTWVKYEGTIISAIRLAEKKIPDNTLNGGMVRLDTALKWVLAVYERTNHRAATDKTKLELREGIQIVHNKLDADKVLRK